MIKPVHYPVDEVDVDAIVTITEENAGKSDEQIAAACIRYLESDERRYRRALQRPKPRLVWSKGENNL
jgi:hypothetical protein